MRIGSNGRHVTTGTVSSGISKADLGRRVTIGGVARDALLAVVVGVVAPKRFVGAMTTQARQRSTAGAEALALLEIRRLMAGVPGIGEFVGPGTFVGGAVAQAAQAIQVLGRQRPRVANHLPGPAQIVSRGKL